MMPSIAFVCLCICVVCAIAFLVREIMSATNNTKEKHLTDELNNLHITCTKVDKCANCGKEGSDLNICNKCKDVKYCNSSCKKKHRKRHKKKCERRAAELHDIELFKQPPQKEDCPICFLLLPLVDSGSKYKSCCGKLICSGCIHAISLRDKGVGLCPFCRTPAPYSDEEDIKRLKKRVEVGDAHGMYSLGCDYYGGANGLPQDHAKALELWHRAGELGYADAYHNIGHVYNIGNGVERNNKKAEHFFEIAAMGGIAAARFNLGNSEFRAGNWDRALKHYMISVGSGYKDSVKMIQQLYKAGNATKEDYTNALRAYQNYLEEVRSEQRDQAAKFNDQYKYY